MVFKCFDGIHDALFYFEVPALLGGRRNLVNRPWQAGKGICVSPGHNATHNISIPGAIARRASSGMIRVMVVGRTTSAILPANIRTCDRGMEPRESRNRIGAVAA
jgi:hypothetical protein